MTEEEKCRLVMGLERAVKTRRSLDDESHLPDSAVSALRAFADIIENAPHPTINELGEWNRRRGVVGGPKTLPVEDGAVIWDESNITMDVPKL